MIGPAHRLSLLLPGDPDTRTGGYIYDRRVAEGLRQRGWLVDVHSLDPSFPQPTSVALEHARGVLAHIPDGRIVVIDGLALAGLAGLLESEAARLCIVALIHHPLALETGLDVDSASQLDRSERAALALVRRVVVTSAWTARNLSKNGAARDQIRVVEPGTDAPGRQRRVSAHGATDDRPLGLLSVAALTPRKGHAVLFDALARLVDRRWHLRCAGSLTRDPTTVDKLRTQIVRLDLGERINLIGEVDQPALDRCYRDCDVFVLASYLEGYGMALAEAAAYGIPIVSTLAGAIPDTVAPNASLLVPPGDPGALAKALAGVMDDPATRNKLADNALASARRLRTWDDAAKGFDAALGGLGGDGP